MSYQPSQEILEKYADVMVNFALWSGEGVKKGDVVLLRAWEVAKPLYIAIRRKILQAGAHVISWYTPDDINREFFELANEDQLEFFPKKYFKGMIDQIDHYLVILSETNKHELEGIPADKLMKSQSAIKPWFEWREVKENAGKFTWTLCLYGTEAMAKEVNMSEAEYWNEIITACFLDLVDPVAKWKEIFAQVEDFKAKLDAMPIIDLHIKSENTDLHVGLDKNRSWMGGSGRNIPSFELFISPDWRKTEGHIFFNQPLYRYGNLVKNVKLVFKEGRVIEATADQGEDVLKEMIKVENADKIGEFSLTDSRHSRITKFMGETLFDENVGGEFGNTHVALGRAYTDSYPDVKKRKKFTKKDWEEMGYNDSAVHTDIISTEDRVVTASLEDGSKEVIYENGQFNL